MSIFGSIKDAIFGHPAAKEAAPPPLAPVPAPAAAPAAAAQAPVAPPPPPKEIDPHVALAAIAKSKGDPDLNWKTSIVDLMKLIGMDSSLDHRKQLADELGYDGPKDGSAEMNIWLHGKVMERIRTGR